MPFHYLKAWTVPLHFQFEVFVQLMTLTGGILKYNKFAQQMFHHYQDCHQVNESDFIPDEIDDSLSSNAALSLAWKANLLFRSNLHATSSVQQFSQ
jgi:hypothetical protein